MLPNYVRYFTKVYDKTNANNQITNVYLIKRAEQLLFFKNEYNLFENNY